MIIKHLISILILLPIITFGQVKQNVGIKMATDYGSKNHEIRNILNIEGIDYYNVQFIGEELRNKHFTLVVKEIWDGKITEIDTILNSSKMSGISSIQSDTLKFTVSAKKFSQCKLKVNFRFDKFANEGLYDATNSLDYSLSDIGTQMKIEVGKFFPTFTYIMPYEKDNLKMWCAVENSGKNIESWGKEFGIKHYLIFEMRFE